MALPKVSVTVTEGGIGRTPLIEDGVAGIIHTGEAVTGKLDLDKVYQLFSVKDAEALGIGSTKNAALFEQIQDFYTVTKEGTELFIVVVASSKTFADIFSTSAGAAVSVVNASNGRVRLLGVSHLEVQGNSVKAASDGLPGNLTGAVTAAQNLANGYQERNQPFQIILAGNSLSAINGLKDYSSGSNNRVSLLISGRHLNKKVAALGITLGTLAKLPVQRGLGRVKNGPLPIANATFTNTSAASPATTEENVALYSALHNKRYLFIRTYPGKVGYYFADDPTLSATTDDTSAISDGRVIDKAIRLANNTYTEELGEEVLLEEDGSLSSGQIRYLSEKMENVLNQTMTVNGEISNAEVYIDPEQNILSNDTLTAEIRITKVGYSKSITVRLGFVNPINS